jgi:CheY-like chemotaxis protein
LIEDAIRELSRIGGSDLVRQMLRLFLRNAEAARGRLQLGLERAAPRAIGGAAHTLYSTAAQLRLTTLTELARALEKKVEAGEAVSPEADAAPLLAALAEAENVVRVLLRALPQPFRIALVEDSADIRLLVRFLLSGEYEIEEYEEPITALSSLRTSPPDLLLLDISLPWMSGFEVLRELRALPGWSGVPVIALTAHADLSALGGGGETEFNGYVAKPIGSGVALRQEIARHLTAGRT